MTSDMPFRCGGDDAHQSSSSESSSANSTLLGLSFPSTMSTDELSNSLTAFDHHMNRRVRSFSAIVSSSEPHQHHPTTQLHQKDDVFTAQPQHRRRYSFAAGGCQGSHKSHHTYILSPLLSIAALDLAEPLPPLVVFRSARSRSPSNSGATPFPRSPAISNLPFPRCLAFMLMTAVLLQNLLAPKHWT
eukprot:Blabericola_migrator_1__9235@NODE_495_length_8027_cov_122_376382_g27_i3_p4_GENE_NODE_495_length_8027_cov_122_376382_g27_i3NODE_495_length_8027_cov_122_376382_g27_i3_p4_ORF_typecomplete_len188_score12_01_NODE_495_length_8027_cov_122_376382_g27_i320092572